MIMRPRILHASSPQWSGPMQSPDELLARAEFHQVKNIARNRAGFLPSPQGTVFIKRFANRSWIEGMLERARGSRAARSLRAARMLTEAGFLVPAPVAACEQISAGSIRTSFIVSDALVGARVLSRFIERGHAPAEQERIIRREALDA